MTAYYVRELRWGAELREEFWCATEDQFYQLGVTSSSGLSTFQRAPGEDIDTLLKRVFPEGNPHKLLYEPGRYFPRMARPNSVYEESPGRNPDTSDEFRHYRARSTGQLHAFVEELDQICRVVHPEGDNLRVYGHATRNLLILSCTEVEAHCKNILEANGYKSKKRNGRLDTTDYVRLLDAMRLEQYVVSLNYYPWLPSIVPFKGWDENNATKSIPWYHAHNQVKHDREGNFAEATLERALTAATACFVMLCAQYGWDFAVRGQESERSFFRLMTGPQWAPGERYVPAFTGSYEAHNYPFSG